jgi:hypothetical protein
VRAGHPLVLPLILFNFFCCWSGDQPLDLKRGLFFSECCGQHGDNLSSLFLFITEHQEHREPAKKECIFIQCGKDFLSSQPLKILVMSFFEKITDGLKLYEVLMLGFGSLMFLVMLVLLVVFAVGKRSMKQLLWFFIIAVLMLGWPSIQKIRVDNKGIELAKTLEEYENKPTEANKNKVEDVVDELKSRDVKDPDLVKKIAKAEFMIGKPQQSLQTIETLPDKEKKDASIVQLKSSIEVSEALKNQLHVVQNSPADSNQIKKLNELQNMAVTLPVKNTQVDSSVRVADQKITEYQRLHPRVDIRRTN